MKSNRIISAMMTNLSLYRAWLQSGSKDPCRCPRTWHRSSLDAFAPEGVTVDAEPLPPEARALYCDRCGRARSFIEIADFKPGDYTP